MDGCGSVPSSCQAGRSVYVVLRRFPFPIGMLIDGRVERMAAYMVVPLLFSF